MSLRNLLLVAAGLVAVGAVALATNLNDDKQQKPDSRPAQAKVDVPFHGNEKCPYTGKAVDKTKSVITGGQLVYLCCDKCAAKAKDDKELAAKAYPADKVVDLKNRVCPWMGEEIEKSKEKVTVMGRTIHLCCDDCAKAAPKYPAAFIALAMNPKLKIVNDDVDATVKCPISGDPVSGKDIAVYNGKVVQFCCAKCIDTFNKDPEKGLAAAEKLVPKRTKKEGEKEKK
ncbi:MAG: hypothetical protein HY286_19755 [Planctomycetes bacterium]|nr:hypothetical protein [Planctomycetota bacterium]